jgi:hypothetical protein
MLINRETGAAVDPILADPATGRPVDELYYALVPGPAAGDRVLEKYRTVAETHSMPGGLGDRHERRPGK